MNSIDLQQGLDNNQKELLIVSNTVNIASNPGGISNILKAVTKQDASVDTEDLFPESIGDFEILTKSFMNNLINWQFLKKMSDYYQWPLGNFIIISGCIGILLEKMIKEKYNSKSIKIDVMRIDKLNYKVEEIKPLKGENKANGNSSLSNEAGGLKENSFSQGTVNFKDKILVLTLKNDGAGICIKKFNKMMFSFAVKGNCDYNFFKFGIQLKIAALRLANSFLCISKTDNNLSIGLISKNIQSKYNTDFILTPVVNYIREDNKYIPVSNSEKQVMNLILIETKFIFLNRDSFFEYVNSFDTGNAYLLRNSYFPL